jgi:(4-O-methyl)-D-glucuronate---lignin esterase
MRRAASIRVIALATLSTIAGWSAAQPPAAAAAEALERGFREPPDSARPRVWWHWRNGNVTREGITLDLEWMKRVGIGGVQMFDASIAAFGHPLSTTPRRREIG